MSVHTAPRSRDLRRLTVAATLVGGEFIFSGEPEAVTSTASVRGRGGKPTPC
jgi:hypothetical protein